MISAAKRALEPDFPCRLFEGLDHDVLAEIVRAANSVHVKAGQILVHLGEASDRLYVLTSGAGQMSWGSDDGQRTVLHAFGPGGIAGGEAILRTPTSYMSTTEIVEDGEALTWTRDVIRALAYRYPPLFDNALMFAAEMLQILLASRISVGTEDAEGRLAHALLHLSERVGRESEDGPELHITNAELADMAHTSPYTASRIVSDWARQGIIRHGRGRIVILSEQRLRRGR